MFPHFIIAERERSGDNVVKYPLMPSLVLFVRVIPLPISPVFSTIVLKKKIPFFEVIIFLNILSQNMF